MDTVIKKISEIEAAATSVMDDANARKKAFAQEMADKTAAFDQNLENDTEKQVSELRARMEVEMNSKLSKQKTDADALLASMVKNYEDHHEDYVRDLFQTMIKE